jgi:hypothetical protein
VVSVFGFTRGPDNFQKDPNEKNDL